MNGSPLRVLRVELSGVPLVILPVIAESAVIVAEGTEGLACIVLVQHLLATKCVNSVHTECEWFFVCFELNLL